MRNKYNVGDLVSFDLVRSLGIVVETKKAEYFELEEDEEEYLIKWSNGEEFWCLGVTLKMFLSGAY